MACAACVQSRRALTDLAVYGAKREPSECFCKACPLLRLHGRLVGGRQEYGAYLHSVRHGANCTGPLLCISWLQHALLTFHFGILQGNAHIFSQACKAARLPLCADNRSMEVCQ